METSDYSIGFRSQENELELKEIPVQGVIPKWLRGSLIRTAPSKFEAGKNSYRHWFDGLAMLHKFTFGAGKVDYSNKFLESEAYLEAMKKNKIVYGEFGTDPCRDLFQKVSSFFQPPKMTDNGCVSVNLFGDELTATTETTNPVSIGLGNLESRGHFKYEDEITGHYTTVHPHYKNDGTLFSYTTEFGYKSRYHVYYQQPHSHKRELISTLTTDAPAYMHSIGMTENYLILTEIPLVVNTLSFRFGNKPFIENYKWKPERGTKIHLIEKKSGDVRTFETGPFFTFHHVNAFEEQDDVLFDLAGYEDAGIIDDLYLDHLRSAEPTFFAARLWRFRIKPDSKKVTRKLLSPSGLELPRINYAKVNGLPYTYVYGGGNTIPGNFIDNITKINVESGKSTVWHEENCYPGEPVFVEKPNAAAEDDGLLLSIVLDTNTQTSFLLILDAKDLTETGRAYVPQHITFGFHGQYVNSEDPDEVLKTIHS